MLFKRVLNQNFVKDFENLFEDSISNAMEEFESMRSEMQLFVDKESKSLRSKADLIFNGPSFPEDSDKNFNKVEETGENQDFSWKRETWTSLDGYSKFERFTTTSKQKQERAKVKELEASMEKAVSEQRFEDAAKLRDEIKKVREEKKPKK